MLHAETLKRSGSLGMKLLVYYDYGYLPYAVSVAFGLIASIIFIVVQIGILVDFAHNWAEKW